MVSKWYDFGEWKLVRGGAGPENTQVTNPDAVFGVFRSEIPPLDMLKRVVQSNVIRLFKSTFTNEINEKWEKGNCEFCDEHFDADEPLKHECSLNGFSLLILHQGMKDELMAIIYHEITKEEENEKEEHNLDLKGINLENTQLKERKVRNYDERNLRKKKFRQKKDDTCFYEKKRGKEESI